MSEAATRNFADFYLGDNVYELAGGLIPEIAERLDVKLSNEPNSADLQEMMSKVGPNRVLRHNQEITAIDRDTMADMIDRAGTQQALNRSLRTPEIEVNEDTIDAFLQVTCMGNWQDRGADALPVDLNDKPVYSVGGVRVMDTATEVANPNVVRVKAAFGRYPTEAEYAGGVIIPKLVAVGFNVLPHSYPTKVGDELLNLLFEANPELLEKRIAVVRNANAGVISAIQMRDVARKMNPDFDADPKRPQALVVTDSSEVARTDEQEADSRHFQKVGPGLRQLVLVAKKKHEAAGGE